MRLGVALQRSVNEPDGNAARDAELQPRSLELEEGPGACSSALGAVEHLAQMRLHGAAQLGQMRMVTLAIEKRATQLVLEQPDGSGQGGLRDIAALGCAREVQGLAERHEVSDLMHLQGDDLPTTIGAVRSAIAKSYG